MFSLEDLPVQWWLKTRECRWEMLQWIDFTCRLEGTKFGKSLRDNGCPSLCSRNRVTCPGSYGRWVGENLEWTDGVKNSRSVVRWREVWDTKKFRDTEIFTIKKNGSYGKTEERVLIKVGSTKSSTEKEDLQRGPGGQRRFTGKGGTLRYCGRRDRKSFTCYNMILLDTCKDCKIPSVSPCWESDGRLNLCLTFLFPRSVYLYFCSGNNDYFNYNLLHRFWTSVLPILNLYGTW